MRASLVSLGFLFVLGLCHCAAEHPTDLEGARDGGSPATNDNTAASDPASGTSATPSSDPATGPATPAGNASAGCSGATLCDDFEKDAIDAAAWETVTPNCKGTGTLALDTTQAHGGKHSVKVTGAGGYCNHVFLGAKLQVPAGGTLYGRFFVKLTNALGDAHVTFAAFQDATDKKDIRMGGQSKILMWNREQDDATLPELSPAGQAKSVKPTTGDWHCVEIAIDGATGGVHTWFEGASVEGLVADDETTPDVDGQWRRRTGWKPTVVDAKLGWESYGGDANTVWFDDVAFGSSRIGCGG